MSWICAFWGGLVDAAARCCCRVLLRVLLLESRVRFGAGLRVPLQGAGAGYLGAATGCCCQSAVCPMKLGYWCRCRGGCEMSMAVWALGPDGGYVYAVAKKD